MKWLNFKSTDNGFTLIEIIAVLVIVGIIAAVAATRVSDDGMNAELISQISVIKSHIRYAQSRAMATEDIWGVKSQGTTYFLFRNGESNKITLPGENSKQVTLSDKGVDFLDNFIITFNKMGSPSVAASIKVGAQSNAIEITAVTGYIP